uniref:Enzymatic polyprotein n=1 Tax=Physostegia virginiana caulimovirus 1 TaxID=3075963 RepID=A0AA96C244_9VIRU|nr:reverse transcriptase [Physostegia virginiana caulimovirus 1]
MKNQNDRVMNITNPNSIYIEGTFWFKGYKRINLHCYVDTGASLCIASKYVIPEEHWVNAERPIQVKIADGSNIAITKVCKDLNVGLAGKIFHIPTVYQQESGIDFIFGNNFCQLYEPFVQYTDRIYLTVDNETVIITKLKKALSFGNPSFLESMKKLSKVKTLPPVNISKEKITLCLERGRLELESRKNQKIFLENQTKFSQIEKTLENVCSENPLDPNKTKRWMKASIKLIDPTTVIKVKPMKYSPMDKEEFGKQIQELLELKVIRPSKSPFMSPAFLVENEAERRRGKKRMVINYKDLNKVTIGDSHNLPNKDELLALIRGKAIFSSFDCKSGFWQVLLDEESKHLTAFTCPQGHYEWNVVPFGLKQAPSIFQRHMQTAFNIFEKFCCVYVDDILVYSNTEQEHYLHVMQVLKRCEQYGILLSKKKTQLFRQKINFLGLEIEKGFHKPQNHILEHIHKFPNTIEDKKQLQRFLGILTYASDYIPNLAKLRAPLQVKLKDSVSWQWNEADTQYLAKIKKKLIKFPDLYHPSEDDKLHIETDASDLFWGGVLKATKDDEEFICRFTSGSFKAAEKNYHSNDKELLAVIRVIKKFSIYLTPCRFIVKTDNKNLTYFLNTKITGDNKQGRAVRWQNWLSRYCFDIVHIAGTKNVLADFLTREFQS